MKTNFDWLMENKKRFVKRLALDDNCLFCIYAKNEKCENHDCEEGIMRWLQQPLPMNEQFTDKEIEMATELKDDNDLNIYIARDKNDILCLYNIKPYRDKDCWVNPNFYLQQINHRLFPYIKWEDEPILLDDIIISKDK